MQELLTADECLNLAGVMDRKYASVRGDRVFKVGARKGADGVWAQVQLSNANQSFHYPAEARIKAGQKDISDRDAALLLIDYLDAYFDEYLNRDQDTFLPIDWADYEQDGHHFQLRGQVLNLELENMADAILEQGGMSLA